MKADEKVHDPKISTVLEEMERVRLENAGVNPDALLSSERISLAWELSLWRFREWMKLLADCCAAHTR